MRLGSLNKAARLTVPSTNEAPKILVVEDKQKSRDHLEACLLGWGLQCVFAASAGDAIRLVDISERKRERFAAILFEKELRFPQGFEALAALQSADYRKLPVIVAHAQQLEPGERERCEELGVICMVAKPYEPSALQVVLAQFIAPHQEAAESVAEPNEMPQGLRILLAEDNPANQRLIARLLEKMGHVVTIAENGEAALRLVAEKDFDLIAMDMEMPVMNGLEATERIRGEEKKSEKHIPIIAITANTLGGDRRLCQQAGMDGYIAKPASGESIAAEISRVMKQIKLQLKD